MQTNDIEIEVLSKEEKREYRRQRRIRNQRIAIIALIASVLILVGVIVGGIFLVNRQTELKKQQLEIEEQLSALEGAHGESAEVIQPEVEDTAAESETQDE